MKSMVLKKLLLFIFCILFCAEYSYAATAYYGSGVSSRTMYNPVNNTVNTIRVNTPIINGRVTPQTISGRAHTITPSVQYTHIPTPGYRPLNPVYNPNMPASGIVIRNSNGVVTRYPVNNTIPYYDNNGYYNNGYYVNTVQYPVVTHTSTMTTGNGSYTYSEDYIPRIYNTTTYTNGRRFLSW